jgi:trans-aconitate 2-methyltransferase
MSQVALGGALAIQLPAHYQSPLHLITLEVSNKRSWTNQMDLPRNALTKKKPSFYYEVLQPFSAMLEIWETEYYHILDSPESILEWFRGTGLRPFLEALQTEEQKKDFEQMLLDGISMAYPRQKDGRVLFPFRRLFVIAYR